MLAVTLVILRPHHHRHRSECRAIKNSEVVSMSRGAGQAIRSEETVAPYPKIELAFQYLRVSFATDQK